MKVVLTPRLCNNYFGLKSMCILHATGIYVEDKGLKQ